MNVVDSLAWLECFEVFKRTPQLKGEVSALEAADSIILATARSEGAVLRTQDAHFQGLEKVEYRETRKTVG